MPERLVRPLPGLAGLAFGLGLLVLTLRLDVDLQRNVGGAIGPEAYPGLLAAAILLLSLLLLWQTLRGRAEPAVLQELATAPDQRPAASGRVLLALLLLCAYTLLLEPLGFLVATPLLLIALMRLTGERRWWLAVPSALLMTVLLYAFFRYGMNLVLPEGLLGEHLG
jgi:putative tricarboxylic transport membrane protein